MQKRSVENGKNKDKYKNFSLSLIFLRVDAKKLSSLSLKPVFNIINYICGKFI